MTASKTVKLTLLAGAMSALAVVPAARADDIESVTVRPPHYQIQRSSPLGVPYKISLSRQVSYSDLDLRTRDGARELRMRVGDTARDICDRLAEDFPAPQQPGTSCYREAYRDAILRADTAIHDAREDAYYRADYRHY